MKRFLVACLFMLLTVGIVFGEETKQKPQTLIGNEIVAIAQAMLTITEDFTKSRMGGLAYYALVWKFIIKPILNIILCIPTWIILNYVIWKKCDHFFGTERVEHKNSDGTVDIEYVRKYKYAGDGALGAGIAIAALAIIVNLCGFIIVFG